MSEVYTKTINDFLAEASSSSPTPGGGNVSAVVATLGGSMIAMVASLTQGKKGYEEFQDENKEILDAVMKSIEELKELTLKDMAAFEDYMKAFRMPKETDEEKNTRKEAIQAAAKNATMVPLTICRSCLDLLKQADKLSRFGNKMAISDVGVGAYVCEAALRACMLSVDINIPSIKDEAFVADVTNERARLFAEAESLKGKALAFVNEKMG
ncbi:MAG: cyclodeaminase/cyclohydrolase family protein [Deltaproteobacteria bacterium]|nr:cyclodeaminase/cyclohydrolase family protein [Deltaproteobacteria bacterium]MBW2051359.1 cyclodeaminase/cyclohydrolase family protein [Deltaproteobacteria bacterium]MBW2139984.1 cyclodeaminase/cyclohydrolase family protein [Deltaproteobacteria bacterium]MBW2324796.1 cyclodeaminase/cyclohydrolase family protein [Deltaproteobacteria bacterium]